MERACPPCQKKTEPQKMNQREKFRCDEIYEHRVSRDVDDPSMLLWVVLDVDDPSMLSRALTYDP